MLLSASGTMAEITPLRYRGYYYDSETGFYYLQSRYYDPEMGRFINADAYTSTGQGLLGNNMFPYCLNNPTFHVDSTGELVSYACIGDNYHLFTYCHLMLGGCGGGGGLNVASLHSNAPAAMETGEAVVATAKQICKAVADNVEFSCGVGLGYYGDFQLFGTGIELGMKGDVFYLQYEDSEWFVGTSLTELAFSVSAITLDVGFNMSYIKDYDGQITDLSWFLINGGLDSTTIKSASIYLIAGAHYRIGFDTDQFIKDLTKIF